MYLTLSNWLLIAIEAMFIIPITIYLILGVFAHEVFDEKKRKLVKKYNIVYSVITILIALAIIGGTIFGFNWFNTSTASGARYYKDFQSELSNGINREITITAEDGRMIFHYEGKVDIESNHEDNYIKFESEEGKRYIIYYGIQDTITIIEK